MLRTVTRWQFNEIFSVTLFEGKWLKTCNGKRLVSISEHLESSDFDPLVCPACFRVTILLFRMTLERVTSCQRLNATPLCVILGRLNQQGNKHSSRILEEQNSREIWISRAHIKNPFKPHELDDKMSVKKVYRSVGPNLRKVHDAWLDKVGFSSEKCFLRKRGRAHPWELIPRISNFFFTLFF